MSKKTIKPLLVIPPNTINDDTAKAIKRAGYLIVHVDDPRKVQIMVPPPDLLSIDVLARVALEVMLNDKAAPYDQEIRRVFRARVTEEALKGKRSEGGEKP